MKEKEKQMKKLLLTFALLIGFSAQAMADITLVVPQKPGAGTSVWAQIVAGELEKFLPGEKVTVKHIPGARSLPGFNKFHKELQYDDEVIMVSNGGNALSFLTEPVDYNYGEYDSIGAMNLDIITGKLIGTDMTNIKLYANSGRLPEVMAMSMLLCGPSVDPVTCFKNNVTWVPGFSQKEGRLAFKRQELNVSRENPAAFKKHIQPMIDAGEAEVWFTHGILQPDGSHADDPNFPGMQFEILYEKAYGVKPSGDFYDAYVLAKSFRDGLQKALWIRKGNPNRDRIVAALTEMSQNPESIKAIQKKVGNYDWVIGDAGNDHRDTLMTFITPEALQMLIDFQADALGFKAIFKPELLK